MTYYGLHARIHAILHKLRHPRHKLIWRLDPNEFCPGDIVCDTCNVILWCRALDKKDLGIG